MPAGVNITLQEKLDIDRRRIAGRDPYQVWQEQYFGDNSRISLKTIVKLGPITEY